MLLVIFMITEPVLQSGIEVNVPKTRTVKQITEQRMVVTIDRDQNIFLNDQPVNIHDLPAKLHQAGVDPAHQAIYLRSDERVPFGAFASVMDAVKQSGITNVSIVTQPLETKGSAGAGIEHSKSARLGSCIPPWRRTKRAEGGAPIGLGGAEQEAWKAFLRAASTWSGN